MRLISAFLFASAIGCGYHAGLEAGEARAPFAIELGRASTPSSLIESSAAAGARDELAAVGLLAGASDSGAASIVVQILAVETRAAGIESTVEVCGGTPSASNVCGSPRARGIEVIVRGRARLRPRGSRVETQAVDLEEHETVAGTAGGTLNGAASSEVVRETAARAAARRLGARLVRRLLGAAEPDDP